MNAACEHLVRVIILTAALCGIGWAAVIWQNGDNSSQLSAVATRIMAGQTFRDLPVLVPVLDAADNRKLCNPLELRSAVIIRARLYETDPTAEAGVIDQRFRALLGTLDRALRCTPTDAYLWFLRYWTAVSQGQAATDAIRKLGMSYRLGPNEGWIVMRRNVFALAVYDLLPPEFASMVRSEFGLLVRDGVPQLAARNLRSAGWSIRDELLGSLAAVKPAQLMAFDRELRRTGLQLRIPNLPEQEFRPWRQ